MEITKRRIIYTIAVTFIVIFSTTFAILMTLERIDYRNYLQGEYNKNMYQLINSVENIGNNLAKAPIVGSREQSIVVLGEIFRYAGIANDKLHSLPVAQEQLAGTSKFVSQVGDFCYILADKASKGGELSNEDISNIDNLKKQSVNLENQLKNVQNDISLGKIRWGEIRKKASNVLARNSKDVVNEGFQGIQKQVTQYPALVYDGPFSDNTQNISPKINEQKEVTKQQAEEVVKKVIGSERIEKIEDKGAENNTKIPTFTFNVSIKGRSKNDNKIACEISKKGGKVVYLLDGRDVNKPTIDIKKANEIGAKYLENIGYKNMIPTYSLHYDNIAIISYVFTIDNINIYPDQLKLKVALDNGSIVGIESEKYLVSHSEDRKIGAPKVTEDKAKERVGKRLNITSAKLALVPTEANKEVLCYEFIGNYKNDDFIVYINADTGYEQKILQIRNTPNGQLTL